MLYKEVTKGEDTKDDVKSFMLDVVRYIPDLKRNLISVGTLEKEAYNVKMQM